MNGIFGGGNGYFGSVVNGFVFWLGYRGESSFFSIGGFVYRI